MLYSEEQQFLILRQLETLSLLELDLLRVDILLVTLVKLLVFCIPKRGREK